MNLLDVIASGLRGRKIKIGKARKYRKVVDAIPDKGGLGVPIQIVFEDGSKNKLWLRDRFEIKDVDTVGR